MTPSVGQEREHIAVGKCRRWKVSGQALEADHLSCSVAWSSNYKGALSPPIETQKGTRPKPLYSTLYFHSFSSDGHIHFATSSSLPTLPIYIKTYIYMYIYIYMSPRKPADSLAHNRLCSLMTNRQRRTHITSLRMPFFTSTTLLNPDEKAHPLFPTVYRVPAMPTSPHTRTLYIMLAYHFILRTHVAPISTSPLPATLCPLYLHTHIYIYFFTYPTHCLAHEPPPPSLLNTPPASAPHFLRDALFHLQIPPEPGQKRAPPPDLCLLLSIYIYPQCGCDVNFAP